MNINKIVKYSAENREEKKKKKVPVRQVSKVVSLKSFMKRAFIFSNKVVLVFATTCPNIIFLTKQNKKKSNKKHTTTTS